MAETDVPIRISTDSKSVGDAQKQVSGLSDGLKGLGPAAAQGAGQAAKEFEKLGAAAAKANAKIGKDGRARDERGRFLGSGRAQAPVVEGGVGLDLKSFMAKASKKDVLSQGRKFIAEQKKADKARAKGSGFSADAVIGSAATGALAAITALYAAVGMLAVKFAGATLAAQAFKESTKGAFKALLGSASAADKAFKDTLKTADQIGMGYEDALKGVNSLIAKGFKADQAQELVKAMADLKAVVPDANISNLLLAVTQIKSKGVLQMEELQGQIAEAGLSVSVVLEEIGKKIGKSGQEVRKMIAAGKISADQGVQGILAAIQKTTGKSIGKAAEEASKSLGGLLARLEQIPGGLLLMADASKGVEKVKGALSNVLSAFAPSTETGKLLADALGKLGDAFGSFFSGLTGPGGESALKGFATGLAGVISDIARFTEKVALVAGPVLGGLIKGLGDGMNKGRGMGKSAADSTAQLERLGIALGKAAEGLGRLIGLFVGAKSAQEANQPSSSGLDGLIASIERAIALYQMVEKVAASIGEAAMSIGTNLVNGIIAGISAAAPMLAGAVQRLASLATGTMQTATQIHSPSKLWRDDIGYQLPAGAAEGMYDGAPLMADAAKDVAGSTTRSGSSAIGAGGATGRAISIVFETGSIVVQAGQNARSIADELVSALRTELEAIV